MTSTLRKAEMGLPSLTMSRVFQAPRDLMFKIWTEPQHIDRWWAPHDFTVPESDFEARPGSRLRIDFRSPGGHVFANYGDVKDVSPPDRLVFTTEYREGDRLMVASLVTATFEDLGDKTRVTIQSDVTFAEPEAADSLAGMEEGWNQQIDKLELHAARASAGGATTIVAPVERPYILMRRSFAAPRALVWSCFTRPERLAAWWGPHGHSSVVPELEARRDGRFRIEQSDPEGNRSVFHGAYLDVVAPERLVNTIALEGRSEAGRVVNTRIFEELDGGTLVTAIFGFESVEARARMVATGMEGAARQSYDRLEALVTTLAKEPSQ